MTKHKLLNKRTNKHANHQLYLQQVIGNGVVHMGLFCQKCKRNNWITWLNKDETEEYKKTYKIKELPPRKSK
jgi:hypothetical protein